MLGHTIDRSTTTAMSSAQCDGPVADHQGAATCPATSGAAFDSHYAKNRSVMSVDLITHWRTGRVVHILQAPTRTCDSTL
jgi:hypothetical protein